MRPLISALLWSRIRIWPRSKRSRASSEVGCAVGGGSKLLMNTSGRRTQRACAKEIGNFRLDPVSGNQIHLFPSSAWSSAWSRRRRSTLSSWKFWSAVFCVPSKWLPLARARPAPTRTSTRSSWTRRRSSFCTRSSWRDSPREWSPGPRWSWVRR